MITKILRSRSVNCCMMNQCNVWLLTAGIGDLECSVSGQFYRGFPAVTTTEAPEDPCVGVDSGVWTQPPPTAPTIPITILASSVDSPTAPPPATTKSEFLPRFARTLGRKRKKRGNLGDNYHKPVRWMFEQLNLEMPLNFQPSHERTNKDSGNVTRANTQEISARQPGGPGLNDHLSEPSMTGGNGMTEPLVAGITSVPIQDTVEMPGVQGGDVLLYVHGYNNDLSESLQTLGQMAAFGNFPSTMRIVCYHWPAGRGLASFSTARMSAERRSTYTALATLLTLLADTGIENLHILTHSMGARLVLRACRILFKNQT